MLLYAGNPKQTMLVSLLISLLISNAVTYRRDQSILFSRVVIIGLLYASYIALSNLYVTPLGRGVAIYGGLFNVTAFTSTFNIFILLVSAVILLLTAFYPRKMCDLDESMTEQITEIGSPEPILESNEAKNAYGRHDAQFRIIEYPLIIVFIICGGIFLISTGDLVSMFLSIELQSYGLYILSTLYRNSESSTASGLTYFLLGGLSSCFILLGSALLYANSGTTSLDSIYVIASISDAKDLSGIMPWYQPYYLHLALIIMSVGFLFKVSAAPFHFWSPDVYDGIPTIVTTYVAIVAKISIFAFYLELVYYTEYYILDFSWKTILLLSSLLSLIVGSVLGLTQSRLKRLLAYSTISHVGFILLAMSVSSAESIQAYIFYILQYSITNLNAFMLLSAMAYALYVWVCTNRDVESNLVDAVNSPLQLISQIKGYFEINSFLAISFAITLFSFVGVPPMIGFFAKQMVLSAALDSGYVFMTLVAILTSVIGAGYYLSLVKQMLFYDAADYHKIAIWFRYEGNGYEQQGYPWHQNDVADNLSVNWSLSITISVLTLLLLLFIYIPGEWFNIVSLLTLALFRG